MINLEDLVLLLCLLCGISDSHGTDLFLNKHIKEKRNLFELNICYKHVTYFSLVLYLPYAILCFLRGSDW